MKKVFTAFSISLLLGATLSSFSTTGFNKHTGLSNYNYTSTNKLVQAGQPGSLDIKELADPGNWSTDPAPIIYSSTKNSLKAICFEYEIADDGGADGKLSLKEAISAIKDYYISNNDLPADQRITIENSIISIRL